MSGLQTLPAARRWADLFKSANAPGAAAVVLRHRFEALASQLAELETLRERVIEAEQKTEPIWPNEEPIWPNEMSGRAAASAA
jgi:hypothetical protein